MKCRFNKDRICLECGRPLRGLDEIPLNLIQRECLVVVPKKLKASFPCSHRIGPPEMVNCRECSHRAPIMMVYDCPLHGKCTEQTTGKRIRGIRPVSCQLCADRQTTSRGEER